MPGLPRLAWLARVDRRGGPVEVLHGAAVERRDRWMVEGVWDGPFAEGGFHETENFFGSGLRLTEDAVVFVPSSALLDRLVYCEDGDDLLVSNSLVLLMARTGARLDPEHDYYHEETQALRAGIHDYERSFTLLHPRIERFFQIYREHLVLRDGEISFEIVGEPGRIEDFEAYRELLLSTLRALEANYASEEREIPVTGLTTLSSGYDSPAVATLVREIGVRRAFTSERSNSRIPAWMNSQAAFDHGEEIARHLGLETSVLRYPPPDVSEDELYFLAATPAPPELIFYSLGRQVQASGGVGAVFTGYHGDKVWDANVEDTYLDEAIIRGDVSGLNLTEARLRFGFFNVAVPFIGARSIEDLARISRSSEMEPWRLHNDYDRPIPRRIVESAGVPREVFGQRKKMVVRRYTYPFHARLREEFFAWLRREHDISGTFAKLHHRVNRIAWPIVGLYHKLRDQLRPRSQPTDTPDAVIWGGVNFYYLINMWGVGALRDRLRRVLEARDRGEITEVHASGVEGRGEPPPVEEGVRPRRGREEERRQPRKRG